MWIQNRNRTLDSESATYESDSDSNLHDSDSKSDSTTHDSESGFDPESNPNSDLSFDSDSAFGIAPGLPNSMKCNNLQIDDI